MSKDNTATTMIIRVSKNAANPFVMVDKRVLEDPRLSWKAKGLMGYMLSRPDDWRISLEDLIQRATDGRDAVRTGLEELEIAGYVVRQRVHGPDGKILRHELVVSERPVPGAERTQPETRRFKRKPRSAAQPDTENPYLAQPEPDTENPYLVQPEPDTDFPDVEKPHVENPTHTNTDNTNTNNNEDDAAVLAAIGLGETSRLVLATWRAASAHALDAAGAHRLGELIGREPGQLELRELLSKLPVIALHLGREAVTLAVIEAVASGIVPWATTPMSAASSADPEEPPAAAPYTAGPLPRPAVDTDPVLAAVARLHENEIGVLSPFVADQLRDLTSRFRDLDAWRAAFAAAVNANVRKFSYVRACLENPFPAAKDAPAPRRGSGRGNSSAKSPVRAQRAPVVTPEEMPPPVIETPLPPPEPRRRN